MPYEVTRKQILEAAGSMLGLPFVHQGRSATAGVDCVGLLVVMGQLINYPEIFDVEGYRRTPSANVIRQTLEKNLDEIPLDEARVGDVFLMRTGGIKPRHAAIYFSDQSDEAKGIRPQILHAAPKGVKLDAVSIFPRSWFVAAFRVRGVID